MYMKIQNLPVEIIIVILKKLSYNDLINVCSVSRRFQSIYRYAQDDLYNNLSRQEYWTFVKNTPKNVYKLSRLAQRDTLNILDLSIKTRHFYVLRDLIDDDDIPRFKYYINLGIDINARGIYNSTVLIYALGRPSSMGMINTILDYKPDVNIKYVGNSATMLIYSLVHYSHAPDLIHRILNLSPDIDIINSNDNATALMCALRYSTNEIITRILDLGASINVKDHNDKSVLMYALEYSTPDIVNRILDMNPNINDANRYKTTVLMYSMMYCNNHPQIIHRIINLGADMHAIDNDNHSVSFYAHLYCRDDDSICKKLNLK